MKADEELSSVAGNTSRPGWTQLNQWERCQICVTGGLFQALLEHRCWLLKQGPAGELAVVPCCAKHKSTVPVTLAAHSCPTSVGWAVRRRGDKHGASQAAAAWSPRHRAEV